MAQEQESNPLFANYSPNGQSWEQYTAQFLIDTILAGQENKENLLQEKWTHDAAEVSEENKGQYAKARQFSSTNSIGTFGENLFLFLCVDPGSAVRVYTLYEECNRYLVKNKPSDANQAQPFVAKANSPWDAVIQYAGGANGATDKQFVQDCYRNFFFNQSGGTQQNRIGESKSEMIQWLHANRWLQPIFPSLFENETSYSNNEIINAVNLYLHNAFMPVKFGGAKNKRHLWTDLAAGQDSYSSLFATRPVRVEIKTSILSYDIKEGKDGIKKATGSGKFSIHGLHNKHSYDLACCFFVTPDEIYYEIDTIANIFTPEMREGVEGNLIIPFICDSKGHPIISENNQKYKTDIVIRASEVLPSSDKHPDYKGKAKPFNKAEFQKSLLEKYFEVVSSPIEE